MNDQDLQEWTEELQNIRSSRQEKIKALLANKAVDFSIENFATLANKSLDQVAEEWWVRELAFLKRAAPKNVSTEQTRLRTELEALLEFEASALQMDMQSTKEQTNWSQDDVDAEWIKISKDTEELKAAYQVKITALANEFKKNGIPLTNEQPVTSSSGARSMAYSSGSTDRTGFIWIFLLGLIIGLLPAGYFWQSLKKIGKTHDAQLAKIQIEKKDLEDSFSMYQQIFSRLAEGKQKNIPEIENSMEPIRALYVERRRRAERQFVEERSKLSHKVMSREELERQVQQLEVRKNAALDRLNQKEEEDLKPLQKQITTLKEYMGK